MNETIEQKTQDGRQQEPMTCCSPESAGSEVPMNCPMATMFQESFGSPKFGYLLLIPAFLFILVGVIILIYPTVLVWLMAAAFIVLGLAMLGMAVCVKRCSARLKCCAGNQK